MKDCEECKLWEQKIAQARMQNDPALSQLIEDYEIHKFTHELFRSLPTTSNRRN